MQAKSRRVLTPEGERAREAALALYKAVGLPEPKVVVVTDAERFSIGRHCMRRGVSIFDLAIPSFLLLLAVATVVAMFSDVVDMFSDASPLLMKGISVVVALLAARSFTVSMLDVAKSPFWRSASPPDILIDALVSAGVITTSLANFRSPLIVWEPSSDGSPAAARDKSAVSYVACLAAELGLAAAGGVLGKSHVLLLPTGSKAVVPDKEVVRPGRLDRYLALRRIRRIHKLEPAAAQSLLEENGPAKCMAILGAKPFASDASGALWDVHVLRGRLRLLQVADPATGTDAWLSVPNHVVSPREAVAWTYGMGSAAYSPTLEG